MEPEGNLETYTRLPDLRGKREGGGGGWEEIDQRIYTHICSTLEHRQQGIESLRWEGKWVERAIMFFILLIFKYKKLHKLRHSLKHMPTLIHNFYDNKCDSIHTLTFFLSLCPHPHIPFSSLISPQWYLLYIYHIQGKSQIYLHLLLYTDIYMHVNVHILGYFVIVLLKHIYV